MSLKYNDEFYLTLGDFYSRSSSVIEEKQSAHGKPSKNSVFQPDEKTYEKRNQPRK